MPCNCLLLRLLCCFVALFSFSFSSSSSPLSPGRAPRCVKPSISTSAPYDSTTALDPRKALLTCNPRGHSACTVALIGAIPASLAGLDGAWDSDGIQPRRENNCFVQTGQQFPGPRDQIYTWVFPYLCSAPTLDLNSQKIFCFSTYTRFVKSLVYLYTHSLNINMRSAFVAIGALALQVSAWTFPDCVGCPSDRMIRA